MTPWPQHLNVMSSELFSSQCDWLGDIFPPLKNPLYLLQLHFLSHQVPKTCPWKTKNHCNVKSNNYQPEQTSTHQWTMLNGWCVWTENTFLWVLFLFYVLTIQKSFIFFFNFSSLAISCSVCRKKVVVASILCL